MKRYLLDTNVFLRVLINDNQKMFESCCALIEKIKKNKIQAIVPGIVLSELVWVMRSVYGFDKKQVVSAVQAILQTSGIELIDSYDYSLAIQLYSKVNVKYIDCVIASMAMTQDCEVISYDVDFDKLQVKRLQPEQVDKV